MPANNVVVMITGKDDTQSAFQAVQENLTKMGEKAQETQSRVESLSFSFGHFFEAEFAVHAVLDGLARLREMVEQVGEVSERMNIMHEATGISTEALAGFAAEGHMAGVSLEQLQRSVSHMEQSFEEARQGLTQDKRAYSELGVSVEALSKKHASMTEVLMTVADGFQHMTDPAKRAYAAIEIFGRAGSLLLPFLEEGSAGIRKMSDRLTELGVDASPQAIANLSLLDRQMRMLEIGSLALAGTFVQTLEPDIEAVGRAAMDLSGNVGDLDKSAAGLAGHGLRQFVAWIMEVVHWERQASYEAQSWADGMDVIENKLIANVSGWTEKARAMARAGVGADLADMKSVAAASKAENEGYIKALQDLSNPTALHAKAEDGGALGDENPLGKAGKMAKEHADTGALAIAEHPAKLWAEQVKAQEKYAAEYDRKIYELQETYRSYMRFNKGEDNADFQHKMDLMDKYYAAMKQHVDPAFDPVVLGHSQAFLRNVTSITGEITTAATATDNFAKAWERAALQITKLLANQAIARWITEPMERSARMSAAQGGVHPMAAIADAVSGGMPRPAGMDNSKPSFASFLKASGLSPAAAKGSGAVVVNLYNQGSASTVSKAGVGGVGGGSDSATSGAGLDEMLEQKVVNIFLKDATTNGPMWQAVSSLAGAPVP